MKILMVCLGNICRSPLAEGILQHKAIAAGLDWQVDSAGTNYYHTGEAPHPLSQKVALQNGIDICRQKARRFVKEDLENFDILYAMSEDVLDDMQRIAGKYWKADKVSLLMEVKYPGQRMSVPDPWYGTEPGYHQVFAMIDEACTHLIEQATIRPANQ